MTISVSCSTPEDSVFFAGELFTIQITFTNNVVEVDELVAKSIPSKLYIDTLKGYAGSLLGLLSSTTPAAPPSPASPRPRSLSAESPVLDHSNRSFASVSSRESIEDEVFLKPPLNVKIPKRNTQTIAWAFAQMTGQFVIDPHYIKKELFVALQERVLYKTPGQKQTSNYGGGSLSSSYTHHDSTTNGLPLYNTPPTILFCDQELDQGESKTYKYEILLPSVLPPSHRGKVIRFQYKLVIGVQRDVRNKVTQVFSIPFRFFNRTNADGSRPVFEVLNPVVCTKDEALVTKVTLDQASPVVTSYLTSPIFRDSMNSLHSSSSRIEVDHQTSSIDNVVNTLQIAGKVTYDICKNNEHIAKLILPRVGFRLGEVITVILNFSKSTIPCYHISIFLESFEVVDSLFAIRSKETLKTHTRILHSEFHQQTLNSLRTTAILQIPIRATPEFTTTVCNLHWQLRFEFITGIDSQTSDMAANDGDYPTTKVDVEPFDCTIPLKVYGALKMRSGGKKVLDFTLK